MAKELSEEKKCWLFNHAGEMFNYRGGGKFKNSEKIPVAITRGENVQAGRAILAYTVSLNEYASRNGLNASQAPGPKDYDEENGVDHTLIARKGDKECQFDWNFMNYKPLQVCRHLKDFRQCLMIPIHSLRK
uniref:Uncharacterized protein n=1 Tax=Ditylenchus dipsaci TaxID=166011 RepID=A0A915DWJ9_9BILA